MGLIVCHVCERQRVISPIKRNNYRCSNCGTQNALIIKHGHLWATRQEKDGKNKIEAMRDTYAGLKRIGEYKKYSSKWSLAKFRSIFGIWPPHEISEVPPSPASKALLVWIKKSNDAWKKQKRLEEGQRQTEHPALRLPELEPVELDVMSPYMTAADWEVVL